ncbi:MAG: DUF2778 domain-containing protein [Azoarcus sp.]|jgi:hypothetical protein|nr:DUF2778 domain-containing protein [Azoarcus sp.]
MPSPGAYWIFDLHDGRFYRPINFGASYPTYSGSPGHVNNPGYETVAHNGPIPRGMWRMVDWKRVSNDGNKTNVIVLAPEPGTRAYGRDNFLIHGDNAQMNQSASKGCIIINGASNRWNIWQSGVRLIRVQ